MLSASAAFSLFWSSKIFLFNITNVFYPYFTFLFISFIFVVVVVTVVVTVVMPVLSLRKLAVAMSRAF